MSDRAPVVYQAASLLLAYPEQALLDRLDLISQALTEGDPSGKDAQSFAPILEHLRSQPLAASQAFHVQEFDTSRRHALHLTYWTAGDTRRRGEMLWEFKQVYRESGLLVDLQGELPDHLPMVLEFAAVGDPERGRDLLERYRASLELLRLQLEKDRLPHAGIVQAVCRTLPGVSPDTAAEVRRTFAAEWMPPSETVGLEGYGAMGSSSESFEPESFAPAAFGASRPEPAFLPDPTLRSKS